jgi:hypothetical protein
MQLMADILGRDIQVPQIAALFIEVAHLVTRSDPSILRFRIPANIYGLKIFRRGVTEAKRHATDVRRRERSRELMIIEPSPAESFEVVGVESTLVARPIPLCERT